MGKLMLVTVGILFSMMSLVAYASDDSDKEALQRTMGVVDCDISPDDALTFLNNTYVGTADELDGHPDYLYAPAGVNTLEFRQPGYRTLKIRFKIRAGQKLEFNNKLQDYQPGMPEIQELNLLPAEPKKESKEPAKESKKEEPKKKVIKETPAPAPVPEKETKTSEPLENIPAKTDKGFLTFLVTPSDAAVWIDHMFIGAAKDFSGQPNRAIVKTGEHVIELTRPGYNPYMNKVVVDELDEILIEVALKPAENQ